MPRGLPGALKGKGQYTEKQFKSLKEANTRTLPVGLSFRELNAGRVATGDLPRVLTYHGGGEEIEQLLEAASRLSERYNAGELTYEELQADPTYRRLRDEELVLSMCSSNTEIENRVAQLVMKPASGGISGPGSDGRLPGLSEWDSQRFPSREDLAKPSDPAG